MLKESRGYRSLNMIIDKMCSKGGRVSQWQVRVQKIFNTDHKEQSIIYVSYQDDRWSGGLERNIIGLEYYLT